MVEYFFENKKWIVFSYLHSKRNSYKKTENMEKMSKNQKGEFIFGNMNIKSTYKDVQPD